MFKICDSLGHGAELKLMKICGGKTVAGLHVEHQDSSVQRQWLQKDRRLEHVPKQRTPFRATLTMSGCLQLWEWAPSWVLLLCCLTSDPP